jgi:hypothetical protein
MHIPYNYDLLSIVLGHTETNKVKVWATLSYRPLTFRLKWTVVNLQTICTKELSSLEHQSECIVFFFIFQTFGSLMAISEQDMKVSCGPQPNTEVPLPQSPHRLPVVQVYCKNAKIKQILFSWLRPMILKIFRIIMSYILQCSFVI